MQFYSGKGLNIPLQVLVSDLLKTDGTFARFVVAEAQVVEHAGPTVDVAATSDFGRDWRTQAYRAVGNLGTRLQHHLLDQIPVHQKVGVRQVTGIVGSAANGELATVRIFGLVEFLFQLSAY